MCGITGFLSEGEYEKKEKSALKENEQQDHVKGPDDEGYYVDRAYHRSCHAQAVDHRT